MSLTRSTSDPNSETCNLQSERTYDISSYVAFIYRFSTETQMTPYWTPRLRHKKPRLPKRKHKLSLRVTNDFHKIFIVPTYPFKMAFGRRSNKKQHHRQPAINDDDYVCCGIRAAKATWKRPPNKKRRSKSQETIHRNGSSPPLLHSRSQRKQQSSKSLDLIHPQDTTTPVSFRVCDANKEETQREGVLATSNSNTNKRRRHSFSHSHSLDVRNGMMTVMKYMLVFARTPFVDDPSTLLLHCDMEDPILTLFVFFEKRC